MTLGENLAFHCAEMATKYFIADFCMETFETGVFPALDLCNKLLSLVD
jgi:hypothetical protein